MAVAELVLAVLCAIGVALSWNRGLVTTGFAAAGELPAFEVTRYAGPWLLLATLLLVLAGVLVIDGVSRLRRAVTR
ncbi:hypothetical protein [Nocardia sp. NPDC048505]|uniref:hypothetical protein n=1 Tax=unclassified Nocardia TaxID=2637762 RepID=UPI0033C45C3D